MVDVASLLVRLGADASGFMSTMSRVGSRTSQIFGVMRGASRGVTAEFTESLGIKLPAAINQAVRGFDFLGAGLQSFSKDVSLTSDVSKVAGEKLAALSEGALRAGLAIGTAIRPWVNEISGFNDAVARARSTNQEWIDALADDAGRFEEQLALYERMREKLGLLSDEWQVGSEHTRENATRLALLTDSMRVYARQLVDTKKKVDPVTEGMKTLGNAIRGYQNLLKGGQASMGSFIDQLKEMHGITMDQGPRDELEALMKQFRQLASEGTTAADTLLKSFQPRVSELEEELDRLGISLPEPIERFVATLEGPGSGLGVLEQFIDEIRRELPDAAARAKEALAQPGSVFQNSIRDARGELTELGRELDSFVTKRELIIEIVPKFERYDREMRDRNLDPQTGGLLP